MHSTKCQYRRSDTERESDKKNLEQTLYIAFKTFYDNDGKSITRTKLVNEDRINAAVELEKMSFLTSKYEPALLPEETIYVGQMNAYEKTYTLTQEGKDFFAEIELYAKTHGLNTPEELKNDFNTLMYVEKNDETIFDLVNLRKKLGTIEQKKKDKGEL